MPSGGNAHCFEIVTGTMLYFMGEDPNIAPSQSPSSSVPISPSSVMPNSGVGREVAKAWENAIRQALMPVIFQDNPPAGGNTPRSKSNLIVL